MNIEEAATEKEKEAKEWHENQVRKCELLELVIKIDEGIAKGIIDGENDTPRHIVQGFQSTIADTIKHGTPLPKGHGDLIDVNDLLDKIGLEDNNNNRENNVGEIITLEDFDFIPIIIEAESEE